VASVQAFTGPQLWELSDRGTWSLELFERALARGLSRVPRKPGEPAKQPILFLVNCRDGLQGWFLNCGGLLRSWGSAAYRIPSRQIFYRLPQSVPVAFPFGLHGAIKNDR